MAGGQRAGAPEGAERENSVRRRSKTRRDSDATSNGQRNKGEIGNSVEAESRTIEGGSTGEGTQVTEGNAVQDGCHRWERACEIRGAGSSTGHAGKDNTLALLKRRHWFPKMRDYVKWHLRARMNCLLTKEQSGRKEGTCNPITPVRRPWGRVKIDHLGPLIPSNKKKHIIVMVDSLTKFILLEAAENTSAVGVIKFLKKTFLMYGDPDVLISDCGTAYTAESVEQFLKANGLKHSLISTKHAQANGAVGRINKEVSRMLRFVCEK